MPRKLRYLADGSYYHILTRGNDRKDIFRCPEDYRIFLKIIRNYLSKYHVSILHFCLMPNHVHLLVQTLKASHLPKYMQGVLQTYANYYRKRYESVGFIFQNRYKSFLIEKECYLLDCARYIERNPLRAKLTNDLFSYPWSSFSFYTQAKDQGIIKTPNPLYLEFSKTESERQQAYKSYLLKERPYEKIIDSVFKLK